MKFDCFKQRRSYKRFSMTTHDFCVMKHVCTENLSLCKNYWVPNDINKAADTAFTAAVQYQPQGQACWLAGSQLCMSWPRRLLIYTYLRQASAQAFNCIGISSVTCASFSFSVKREAGMMLICIHLSKRYCFGYFEKIINWIIVLEIYVTHDVISSNLVLFVLTLYKSSVRTFFEHAKVATWPC